MSRQIIIPASVNLIEEIVARFPADTIDFSAMTVVFPGKRPAHFVRKALAERTRGSFIPPKIFSVDAFIDELCTECLQIHQKALETLDGVALLFDIHSHLSAPLGSEHFSTLDRFVPLGIRLYAELEELAMAGVDARQIREALASVPLGRVHSLPEYFDRFYEAVRQQNFVTRSLSYQYVARSISRIDLSDRHEIILAGFYAYTRLEQQIVHSLLQRDNVTFIAQQGPGLQKHLDTIGIDIQPPEPGVGSSPECRFSASPDTHGQVFTVTAEIQTMLDTGKPVNERSVIVLPTADALFPVVQHALSLLPPEGFNIALGYPIQRTPLFGFMMNLLDLTGGAQNGKIPTAEYATFILHPYTKNILFGQRADVTRMLFHAIESFLAERHTAMMLSLESLEGENALFDEVSRRLAAGGIEITASELKRHLCSIHDQTVRKFLHLDTLGSFAARGIEVIQYVHKHSTATRHPLFRQYAERMLEILDALGTSLLAPQAFTNPAAYATFLRHALSVEEVPFPGTPLRGLQVLGLLETRGLSFDTVFMLDVTDDVIPGGRSHSLLLPQQLRERLGLETSRDREQLAEYYFNTLVAGAQRVHFFYSESGNREKSRFLEKLLWKQQKASGEADSSKLVQLIRYNVQLSTPRPEPIPKSPGVVNYLQDFEFTATALDSYLLCPLKFYYAHVLRLAEKEEVAGDVDQREVGILVHNALRAFFDDHTNRKLSTADLDIDRLRSIIDRLFLEAYGSDLVGPAYLVRQQVIQQLEAFLRGYQIPKATSESIVIKELEKDFFVSFEHYRFTGRIDRIERRGTRHVILDYKTGRNDQRVRINLSKLDVNDRATWRSAIGSFQLIVYMLLYSHAKRVSPEAIAPAYLFLGRNQVDLTIESPIGGERYLAPDVYSAVRPVMLKLVDEILSSSVHFRPAEQLEEACPGCPYRSLCGTGWIEGATY